MAPSSQPHSALLKNAELESAASPAKPMCQPPRKMAVVMAEVLPKVLKRPPRAAYRLPRRGSS